MADLLQYFVVYAIVGISVALVYRASRSFQLMLAISAALGVLAIAKTSGRLNPMLALAGATVFATTLGLAIAKVFPRLQSTRVFANDIDGMATVEIAAFVVSASLLNVFTSHKPFDTSLAPPSSLTTALSVMLAIALALFTIWVRRSTFYVRLELQFADPLFASSMGINSDRLCQTCFLLAYPSFFLGCALFALPSSTQVRLEALLELYVMGLALGAFVRFQLHRLWIPALTAAVFQVFGLTYISWIPLTATPIVVFAALMLFFAGKKVKERTLI